MVAVVVFTISFFLVAWIYIGYPLVLILIARVRPAPRLRAPLVRSLSIVISAYNEEQAIAEKIANIFASCYPREAIEIVVCSDGSNDATVELAAAAGATKVLSLPRVGKIRALCAGAAAAKGEILVFTDADSILGPETLAELISNFADERVGGVAGMQVTVKRLADGAISHGEGLYWRYEQRIKKLEDAVGSTVSAAGGLYAIRRELFRPPTLLAGADDFLISSDVVRQGKRLVFDDRARVQIESPPDGIALRRKVRVMNGGLRAAFSLGRLLIPFVGGLYGFEVLTHKILRRLTLFFLIAVLGTSAWLATDDPVWRVVVAVQVLFYGLALAGWLGRRRHWAGRKVFFVPYFFCLANVSAAIAVFSVLAGVRFERWEPSRSAGPLSPRAAPVVNGMGMELR
jgi:cellulose synthase/poly-beta-1,6-N-acetylglucosamine synthase-like glycosyltransferase